MKKSNLIIVICVVSLCALGWLTMGMEVVETGSMYSDYVEQADSWVRERGLYQRAIGNYNLALNEKETEEVYLKLNEAYKLRYNEAPEDTVDDYMDFLKTAVKAYPGNTELVDSFVEMYFLESKYEDIYDCLINAISNGYDTPEVRADLRKATYAYKLKGSTFSGLKQSNGYYYSVGRNKGWNIYSIDDGYILSNEYDFVSCPNEDGMVIATGNDSRILDSTGMVYGIFKGKVTDASLYSENLIAACVDGVYSYYNDFADKQFGEYEMAGSFQDGKAAVRKDGKWMLVDTSGQVSSMSFDEIVIDYTGNHLINGLIIAKSNGVYGLYDEDMKLQCELECSDVDILTQDEIIAVQIGKMWGFVNTDGETVIEPEYEEAKSFSNGIAAVKHDGKWGFIDLDGNLVITYQFSDSGYFNSDGICPVRTDFPEKVIDLEVDSSPYTEVVTNNDGKNISINSETDDKQNGVGGNFILAAGNHEDPTTDDYVESDEIGNLKEEKEDDEKETTDVIASWKLLALEIGIKKDAR